MNITRAIIGLFVLGAVAALGSSAALAGIVGLTWDPSAGAAGYRVYYGPQGGAYNPNPLWTGSSTMAEVNVGDCTAWKFVVTAYNAAGESGPSNVVVSWPRPEVTQVGPSAKMQGEQFTVVILGTNFEPGATVEFDPDPCPGGECIHVDNYQRLSCGEVEFLATVEPTTAGVRPAWAREYTVNVINSNGVVGGRSSAFRVRVNPARYNVELGTATDITRTRLDGDDLAELAPHNGSCLRYVGCCNEGVLGQTWCQNNTYARYDPDVDFDGDGDVDVDDLSFWMPVWGTCWQDGQWSAAACPE